MLDKHVLSMYYIGTMHRDSAQLFWKYNIVIKSKGFRSCHRMGSPRSRSWDKCLYTFASWRKCFPGRQIKEMCNRPIRGGNEARVWSQAKSHTGRLHPERLHPTIVNKKASQGSWAKHQYYFLKSHSLGMNGKPEISR